VVEIKGFIKTSLVDWDGKISAVLFLPRCNFRCPMCHNHELVLNPDDYPDIPVEVIEKYLIENRDFIDGVVITGGEPTLHSDIDELCERFKNLGFPVKLDTNGSFPDVLEYLIDRELVDYIAMDIKSPLNEELYSIVSGVKININDIKRSIELIMNSGIDYEFRTTVVPAFHKREDISDIVLGIKGARRFILQQFEPSNTLSPKLRDVTPYESSFIRAIASEYSGYIGEIKVRA